MQRYEEENSNLVEETETLKQRVKSMSQSYAEKDRNIMFTHKF